MYLKKLELKGFKSFPEKIVLDFDKGITAVVGPNGSGKSNISDAIRWVLGEQSVKNLRGSNKMEDVIFAGTQNRTQLGFAEVSMVIDNSDLKLNIDFNEVVVTRRLYRSGESDFQINGSSCRLKDIHELFMDTGVGRDGYSIIGQGRIDDILSTKSEDRRMFFEEAAGIVKFKTRRIEAEKKLEKEKQNLIRVNDIIYELEQQIAPLQIQAEKTKKYLVLADRLKLVQINIFLIEVEKTELEITESEMNYESLNKEISEEEKKYFDFENKKDELKLKLEEIGVEIELISNELVELRSQTEQKENDIKLIFQQIGYLKDSIKRCKSFIEECEKNIREKNDEVILIQSKKQAAIMELQLKKSSLDKMRLEFENISAKLNQKEETIDRYNAEIIDKMRISSEIRSNIEGINSTISQVLIRKKQIDSEIDFSRSQMRDKGIHLNALEVLLKDTENEEIRINNELSVLEKEKNKIETVINTECKKREDINRNLSDASSRYRILSELEKDYEGYYESVKAILKQKEKNNPMFSGVCGAVGELIQVEQKYETAVETALGGSVQNIVTKNETDAGKAIEYLKQNRKGRATFLPISAVKAKSIGNARNDILSEKGVVGFAKELVEYSPEFENIMSNLLERVIVLDNFSNAVTLAKKYNYVYKIVTLEGELLNPGGSVTGGSISKKTAGIFSRTREIKALEQKISLLNLQLKEADKIIFKANENIDGINESIENGKSDINNLIIKKNDLNNKINQTNIYIKELSDKDFALSAEKADIEIQVREKEKIAVEYNSALEKNDREIEDIQESLSGFQDEMQYGRDEREERSRKLTELRVSVSELEFNMTSYNSDIERINSEILKENDVKEKNKKNISDLYADIEQKQNEIKENQKDIYDLKNCNEEKQILFNSFNTRKEELNKENEFVEKQSLEQLELISKLKNEINRISVQKEQLEERKSRVYNDIWEKYEITFVAAKQYEKIDADKSVLQKEESEIKTEIKGMGNINTDAVEEYKNVKERYEFLTGQRQDILYAEENLKNIISELSVLMEEQFKEQFKIINKNFGKVFSEIFGGGTGFLKLSDENDVLNSGIEIEVQPPGKNIQNMSLLSGGERALTAIALLFAILKIKPSPFCILDEIEAALDDANVKRYADYLKKFSDDTQFVIITHRKGTMEAADTLYGVTMQEQGVSKLVSVKFTDGEAV